MPPKGKKKDEPKLDMRTAQQEVDDLDATAKLCRDPALTDIILAKFSTGLG